MPDPTVSHPGWQWFALGSAVCAALTALLGKVGVSEINSNMATFIRTAVILVIVAAILSFRGEWQPIGQLSTKCLTFLILSGVATGLSWLCYYRALQLAPASRVAPIDKLSVALVLVFAVVFLGEPLDWKTVLGGVLVTGGVVLLAL
jgi:bacterial/archaeal transporter family protein